MEEEGLMIDSNADITRHLMISDDCLLLELLAEEKKKHRRGIILFNAI